MSSVVPPPVPPTPRAEGKETLSAIITASANDPAELVAAALVAGVPSSWAFTQAAHVNPASGTFAADLVAALVAAGLMAAA